MPTVSFPDTPDALLAYLVERTSETIGQRVDRADAVLVGVAASKEVLEVLVGEEEVERLASWVVPGGPPQMLVDVVEMSIERLVAGRADGDRIALAAPRPMPGGTGGSRTPVHPPEGARAVAFVQRVPADEPYAPHLPAGAYRIPVEERGVLAFQEQDHDARGRPVTRDRTEEVERIVEAVEWYAALPKARARVPALIESVRSPNEHIAREALRALAQSRGAEASAALREAAASKSDDLRVRAMLAMWVAGDAAGAEHVLQSLTARDRDRWLASWDLSRSASARGSSVLYGPDPAAARSD